MKIAVVVASKHGATAEVGERVATKLAAAGHDVERMDPPAVTTLAGVDAIVLGSGIYAGSWLRPAAAFVDRFASDLTKRRVWAFSCGPVGDPLKPEGRPKSADQVAAKAGASENRLFPGVVDRSKLSMPERGIVRMLKVPDGDYRDWVEIDAWADEIAADLAAVDR